MQRNRKTFQQQERDEIRGQDRLVVFGPATPDVTVLLDGAEGIDRPFFALHAHHIGMGEDQKRPLRPIPLDAGNQVGAIGFQSERPGGNT